MPGWLSFIFGTEIWIMSEGDLLRIRRVKTPFFRIAIRVRVVKHSEKWVYEMIRTKQQAWGVSCRYRERIIWLLVWEKTEEYVKRTDGEEE